MKNYLTIEKLLLLVLSTAYFIGIICIINLLINESFNTQNLIIILIALLLFIGAFTFCFTILLFKKHS